MQRPRPTLPPRLHVLTDDRVLAMPDFTQRVCALVDHTASAEGRASASGPLWTLHLRGPRTSGARLHACAEELVHAGLAERLTINDRVDIACSLDLRRVHLGQRSMGPVDVRRVLGSNVQIGVSVHGLEEAAAARTQGADLLMVGHVFSTPAHQSEPCGPGLVARLSKSPPPVIAVGGISPARVGVLLRAGAHGVAILRGVWDAPDPASALGAFLHRLPSTHHDVD